VVSRIRIDAIGDALRFRTQAAFLLHQRSTKSAIEHNGPDLDLMGPSRPAAGRGQIAVQFLAETI